MEFFKTVECRYSYRKSFTEKQLSNKDIEQILKAAIAAPTGMHVQTSSYIAITNHGIINKLATLLPNYSISSAPFVLIMLSEDKSTRTNFEIENYSAAAQNVLLAVTALGYATVWTDGVLRNKEINDGIRNILNIPSHKHIRALLPIGQAVSPNTPSQKDNISDLVTFYE